VKEGVLHGPKGLAGQLMRKHDSEAGRRAIRSRMQRVCKCHGERDNDCRLNADRSSREARVALESSFSNSSIRDDRARDIPNRVLFR
jgi:hypothetical protein